MNIREEALQLVDKLNDKCLEKGGMDWYVPYEFRSHGWQMSGVYFMGQLIWQEDNDDRKTIDEDGDVYEPLEDFVVRKAKKLTRDLIVKMYGFK